jgi:hypothetical protein
MPRIVRIASLKIRNSAAARQSSAAIVPRRHFAYEGGGIAPACRGKRDEPNHNRARGRAAEDGYRLRADHR